MTRTVRSIIRAMQTSDGAGVKLRRSLGQTPDARVDPFLMLDEFSTDNPDDYIAGFPDHPHRGFETVTYMLEGHMQHKDHLGNTGDLTPGSVQWMTAGRGIVHSEMPQQEEGRMRGFQLWITLPAAEKMKPAGYRDIPPEQIPVAGFPGGAQAKVIAGVIETEGRELGRHLEAAVVEIHDRGDRRLEVHDIERILPLRAEVEVARAGIGPGVSALAERCRPLSGPKGRRKPGVECDVSAAQRALGR